MLTGIDKDETFIFTSKYDTAEPKTVFTLKVITNKHKMSLVIDGDKVDFNAMLNIVKLGLKSVSGLKIGDKEEVITEITDETLDAIPVKVITEIAEEIVRRNFVSESEAKN